VGERLNVSPSCVSCRRVLQLDEMHYFATEDGAASCAKCEAEWSDRMTLWRHSGVGDEFPSRPGQIDRMPEPPFGTLSGAPRRQSLEILKLAPEQLQQIGRCLKNRT
jgi:hypothetical protein